MVFIIENAIKLLIKYIITLFVCNVFILNSSHADVWTQEKNHGILISTIETKTLNGTNNDNSIFDKNKAIMQNTLNIYGEYGLTNRMTIGGKILLVDSMTTKNNTILSSVTDRAIALDTSQIFTRIKLIKNQYFALSVSTFIGLPSIYKESNLDTYFSIKKWSYEPKIELGISFNKYNFLTITCGYHRNIDHWYDEMRFELTYGHKIQKLLFLVRLQKYVYITTNTKNQTLLSEQNVSIYDFFIQSGFAKLTASIVFPIDRKLQLEFGAFTSLRSKFLFTDKLNINIYGIYISIWKDF